MSANIVGLIFFLQEILPFYLMSLKISKVLTTWIYLSWFIFADGTIAIPEILRNYAL